MSMFVRGRFDVLPGKRDEFEEIAVTLAELARDEPGTLEVTVHPELSR